MTRRLALTGVALGLAAGSVAPGAAALPPPQQRSIEAGLARAVTTGKLPAGDAARYRAITRRALGVAGKLSPPRSTNLLSVVNEVAAQAGVYTEPRALTLFSMLDENTRYFGTRGPPAARTDVLGRDGIVYRFFPGIGLQFHPLAVFGALNAHLTAGRLDDARTLAAALVARGVPAGNALTWEYLFPFGGGRAPWTSGMAQAVAAQAFARAGEALEDPSLLDVSRKAYRAIPGRLVRQLPAGPWIRLYSFDDDVVLNAQLQAAVSIEEYADIAEDSEASSLAASLRGAAAAMLPRFDTGYWSLYSLGGPEAALNYHEYVISLLERIGRQLGEAVWLDTAARYRAYMKQPPAFELGPPAPPLAQNGTAPLRLWLSKRSSAVVQVGTARRPMALSGGWHTIGWKTGAKPGVYPVHVEARDLAGNKAQVDLLPLVVLEAS